MREADPKYSDTVIIETGEKLIAQGKRASAFAIRNAMGGGNMQRIKDVWENNKDTTIDAPLVTDKPELPIEFKEEVELLKGQFDTSIDSLAKALYNRSHEVAESRVAETIKIAQQAKEDSESAVAEAMQTVITLDNEKQKIEDKLEVLVSTEKQLTAENATLKTKFSTSEISLTKITEELNQGKTTALTSQKTITELELRYQLSKKAQEKAEQNATDLEQERNEQSKKIIALETKLELSISQVQQATKKYSEEIKILEDHKTNQAKTQTKYENQLAVSESRLKQNSAEISELKTSLKTAQKDNENSIKLKAKIELLESQLKEKKAVNKPQRKKGG